jgi:hypothetical protein
MWHSLAICGNRQATDNSSKREKEKASALPLARPPPQGFVATLPDPRARPCPGGREGASGSGLQKEDPKGNNEWLMQIALIQSHTTPATPPP